MSQLIRSVRLLSINNFEILLLSLNIYEQIFVTLLKLNIGLFYNRDTAMFLHRNGIVRPKRGRLKVVTLCHDGRHTGHKQPLSNPHQNPALKLTTLLLSPPLALLPPLPCTNTTSCTEQPHHAGAMFITRTNNL